MEAREALNVMPGIRDDLECLYHTVRNAMASFDLEAARPYLTVPENAPLPTQDQATAMAELMPDISEARFLVMKSMGARIGLYYETALEDPSSSEVTVIRFDRQGESWKLAPNTFNGSSTDRVSSGLLLSRIATDPDLEL